MYMLGNVGLQFLFRPAKAKGGADVPQALFIRITVLNNNSIERPTDLHRLAHNGGAVFVCAVEISHPAEVARGEAGGIRICVLQILRSGYGGAFLSAFADSFSDSAEQFHLRQRGRHERIQRLKHCAVIDRFSDVHELLLSGAVRLFCMYDFRVKPPHGVRSTRRPVSYVGVKLPARSARTTGHNSVRCSDFCGNARTASSGTSAAY